MDQSPPLLERAREQVKLTEAVDATLGGSGRLVLLEGPAGVGKSTLLAVAAAHATASGCEVLTARGDPLEAGIGYALVRQLFDPLLARIPVGRRLELLSDAAAWAAPALGLADPDHSAADEATSMHGLYWLAVNLSERRPLVIVADDAQWADVSSFRWLLYLARRLESLAVTVLVGIRTGEAERPDLPLAELALEAGPHRLAPQPLSKPASEALLTRLYGLAVDSGFAEVCHRRTGGNPLLLSELMKELQSEGIGPEAQSVSRVEELVPDKVRQITLLRIGRLDATAVELIRALAIFGDAAELRDAAALAGISTPEAESAADQLVRANLLQADQGLRFTHPLIRGVVYFELGPAHRAQAHRRAAEIILAGGSSNDLAAAHLLRSRPSGDDWVVERLLEAASAAVERGSAPAAVPLLARASEEPPEPSRRWRVLYELGRAQLDARDLGAAETLARAIDATDDPGEHADAALVLGRMLMFAGQAHVARATLERAIAVLDPLDDRALELEAMLVGVAHFDNELAGVAEERSVRHRTIPDNGSYGSRMLSAQLSYESVISADPAPEGVSLALAALADGRTIRESSGRPDAYVVPISMLAICGEFDTAERFYATATAAAAAGGHVFDFAVISGLRCWTSWMTGRLDAAELQAQDALALASATPGLAAAIGGFATGTLANVFIDRGELDAADTALGPHREELAQASTTPARDLLFASARLAAHRGDWPLAAAQFEACGALHERARIVNPALIPWRSELALALARTGDSVAARALAAEELTLARRFGVAGPVGVALRAVGILAGGEEGLALLEQSHRQLSASAVRLDAIRSAVALGSALRRAGQRVRAREILRGGLDAATVCDARVLAEEASGELGLLGSRPRSAVLAGIDSLTPAERRVAEMAAEGMTNPQIAQALFVTRATVQSHLHATYRKLDISSREQLGAALGSGAGMERNRA